MTLASVLAGHLIGDWIVQTDWQAAHKVWPPPVPPRAHRLVGPPEVLARLEREAKRRSWKANQQHMLGYHLALAACCWRTPPKRLAALIAVSWLTHSFIDRRWPVKWLMEHTGSAPFSETSWGPMCVDQALHLAILALAASSQLGRADD
jgi:hypothetical protein